MADRVTLFLQNDSNEYQQLVRSDALAAARRVGFDLEVLEAGNDAAVQSRQIQDCIRREPAARPRAMAVLAVRDATVARIAPDAARAGIGWVLLNRRLDYLEKLQRDFPRLPVATIGPDQVEAGRLQGRQVRALLPSGGFILYVLGPALTASAQDRLAGLQEALDGSRVEVSQVYGNWQTGLAEEAVAEWLRVVLQTRVRLDLVVCQNDAMAVGARNVLERLAAQHPDLTRVAVTGLDGRDDVGKTLVDQGRLAATIVLPSSGAPAVEWLAKAFKGESVPRAVVLPVTSYPDLPELEKRRRAPR